MRVGAGECWAFRLASSRGLVARGLVARGLSGVELARDVRG